MLKKILLSLKRVLQPYYFGFVMGHSHLEEEQVFQIKNILSSKSGNEITEEYEKKMTSLIGEGYGVSFAAGRMALYTLLKIWKIGEGDEVILPGFTCSVMVNAIWRSGAKPVFSDIDSDTFGSSVSAIKKKISSRTKLIIAQHSFGIPCRIEDIISIGKKYGIYVVEDCALTFDSTVSGIKVGNWGDAAIFSTDHSKPLNTLIGGFLYTQDNMLFKKIKNFTKNMLPLDAEHEQRLYKQFIFERNNFTPERYAISSLITHSRIIIKKLSPGSYKPVFLEDDNRKQQPINPGYPYPAKIPPFLAQLGVFETNRWNSEKQRRKKLLKEYLKITIKNGISEHISPSYFDKRLDIVPLRFVCQRPKEEMYSNNIKNYIDTSWIWFNSPVIGCPDGPESLGYVLNSCPVSEKTGENIFNWPCVLPDGWEKNILKLFEKIVMIEGSKKTHE